VVVLGVSALIGSAGLLAPGGDRPVRAQEPTSFAMPAADELAAAASTPVSDTPATPLDEIDLGPALETAAAHLAALPSEDWEVLGLAPALGEEPTAAFELVRDRIGFDPYPGVLRGAEGTLTARAGNAFDRALLLQALLDAQGSTTRLAFGQLGPDVAAAVVARALDAPRSPMPEAGFSPFAAAFEAAVTDRARRDHALLVGALGDRLTDLAADGTAAARADVTRHAWVQVQQADGTWLDLDPTLPDAQPGATLTTAESTGETAQAADRQVVTLRVIAETLEDGALSEGPVLEAVLDPVVAADQQLLLAFAPGSGGGGGLLGNPGGILGGGGGAFAPMLMVDGAAWLGDPIAISAEGGGGGLLGGGGSTIDLASIVLEVQADAPGMTPRIARHVIADRVPPAIRAAGAIRAEDLLPVADADGTPAVFTPVVHVLLSTGGSSPRAYALQQAEAVEQAAGASSGGPADLPGQYFPIAVAEQTLSVASEQRLVPAIDGTDVRAFVATPRVYLASWSVDDADPTRIVTETDLLIDGIRTLPRAGAPADAAALAQLWYGALQGAVEAEHGLGTAATFDPADLPVAGVSFAMGEPLTVLSAEDTEALAATAHPALRAMLAAGDTAVVPGDPAVASAWWQVAADGSTRAILAPALGGGRIGPGKPPGTPGRVAPVKPLPGGTKQQRRPVPKPIDDWDDEEGKGNEYGTLVNEVGTKVEPVVEPGGNALRTIVDQARIRIIRG
jgi:hypothetical protein